MRPRILNPQSVPVQGTDAHLPALPPPLLLPHTLRQHLQRAAHWTPERPGDGGASALGLKPAAVLVPLVLRESGLQVLLTQRAAHLNHHAGQVSFPGGRSEPCDADAVATALRETAEEVGLHARHIEVLGCLPAYSTVTAYSVTPVLALVQPPFDLHLDSQEVAQAFEVPLAFLMNPAHHQRHHFEWGGEERHFLSMPWQGRDLQGREQAFFIWGATAAMLRNLYAFLAQA